MSEKVYEELQNAKAEIEKLRSECHEKSNLCNSLKRSHDDQTKKIQELNQKLEKQCQETEAKTDEIYTANQSLKDLECKLKEKENIIRSFTSTNDKLRADFKLKLQESEEEKRNIICLLDEANMKILDLEQKNRDFMDKIEVLKEGIVSVSQKKCASESKVAKASKQMRERGDMLEQLEEEKVKLEEEIKWKNERFKHLEEAHEKVRNKLSEKEKEWDMGKSSFLDEISTLETKLDSQITLSEDLKRRLELSNQDLAHEQNLRKIQIQEATNSSTVAKLQKKLKNLEQIHSKCESQSEVKIQVKEAEWRSQMEKVVADLNSCKQEIKEKESLLLELTTEKEKLENLVQIHSKCESQSEVKVKVKEAEWRSQMEKMVANLNSCKQEIEKKESLLLELTTEKEESAVMMVALQSTLLEAKSKIDSSNQALLDHEEIVKKSQIQEASNFSSVVKLQEKLKTLEQIHSKCESQSEIKVKEAEWRSQMEKIVSDLNSCKQEIEKKDICLKVITKEVNDYNSLLLELTMEKEESAIMIVALKSTLLEARSKINEESGTQNLDLVRVQESMKQQHEEEMKKVCELLDMAIEEEADRCFELNEVEFELQIWKSIAENLQVNLQVNQQMRHELEDSLLSQVAIEVNLKESNEEKDKRINDLEQKLDALSRFSKENGEKLEKEIEWWEKEWVTKELDAAIFAQLESEKVHEYEKQSLKKIMRSLEEDFQHSSSSFSSQLAKMQSEINLFHEAWEKIKTTVVVKEIEVDIRDLMIVEMEKDLEKIMIEKEKLMEIIGGVSERINKLSREDGQMMGTLRSIVMSFDEKDHFDPVKENTNLFQSPKRRNMVESGRECRSPLRALNG